MILFTITIHILRKKFSTLNKDVSTIKNTKMLLFKATAQFLVLGCTWIFGVFHFRKETLVMAYLFTILNSFHGVFMFLLYCAANKLVIDEYKIWFRRLFRIKKKERELNTTTTMTTSIMTPAAAPSSPSTEDNRTMEWIKMKQKTEDMDNSKNL
ncbi:adhesion G protein-coupled receptor E3-like [Protopterus annectens]|uniref:adhesion G protein-coupled receptor E3-like n=1 Tax=Protopterus annectens TaxID=7888 RepID=UPI001CFB54DE|nr:adhesion G protein-coupled receptor E3-like [Protopterus annectens]